MNENYKDEIRRIELENEESIRMHEEKIRRQKNQSNHQIWAKVEMRDKLLRSKLENEASMRKIVDLMAEGIGEIGVRIWPGGYNFTPVINPNFELRYDGDKSSSACYNGDTFDLPTRKDERNPLFWHGMDE